MQDIPNLRGELVRRGTYMKVAYKVYTMFNVKRLNAQKTILEQLLDD